MTESNEKLRLDKYLWAIRLFKTRSQAAAACEGGKVRLAGQLVKAARTVVIGDEYDVRTEARRWRIRVKGLLAQRMAFASVQPFYEDITPPEEKERIAFQAASFHTGKRQSKIGRPTKKQRRDLDDFFPGA